ncbi:MAG TPA: CPBP family intramembrane glutamic endopeptidase [Gemmatimonadales bacterium]|nr:CPBP family intramembrane glutamic endopeptidase [Gemmatimonadales bacterium]
MIGRGRALGSSLAFLGGGFALALVVLQLIVRALRPALPGGAFSSAALQTAILLLVFAAMTWLIGVRGLGLRPVDFGLVPVPDGLRGFRRGFFLGGLLAAAAMAAAVALGKAEWRQDGGTLGAWLGTVAVTTLLLLPAALVEELVFRGVPMVALSRAFGRGFALVGLALLFGAAHLWNDGITPLALGNIVLAGVFLGLAFFTSGGLWTSTGAHLGWNLTLAGLAAPVSGLLLPIPWLDYTARGPAWISGGGFGPEGGILASLCLAAGAALVGRRKLRETIA